MKAQIAVDSREGPLFCSLLESHGAEVSVSSLCAGDFICSDRVAIERKTRADFESSVIDGRLFDQLSRLSSSYPRTILIVEGKEGTGALKKPSLLGAYSSVITDYGAGIFFTASPKSTSELIYAIARHEQLIEKRPIRVCGKPKGKTLTQNQRAIVEMLPLVGPKMARSLLDNFGTVENVFHASEEELLKVEGMGKKKAKAIRLALSTPFEPQDSHEESEGF
jgi:Fanconi anemia group M protein